MKKRTEEDLDLTGIHAERAHDKEELGKIMFCSTIHGKRDVKHLRRAGIHIS